MASNTRVLVLILLTLATQAAAQGGELRPVPLVRPDVACPAPGVRLPAIRWTEVVKAIRASVAAVSMPEDAKRFAGPSSCPIRVAESMATVAALIHDWARLNSLDVAAIGTSIHVSTLAAEGARGQAKVGLLSAVGCLSVSDGWRLGGDAISDKCVTRGSGCGGDHSTFFVDLSGQAVPLSRVAVRCVDAGTGCASSISGAVVDVGGRVRMRIHARESVVLEVVGEGCVVVFECPWAAEECVPRLECQERCGPPSAVDRRSVRER